MRVGKPTARLDRVKAEPERVEQPLTCAECGVESTGVALGWRAYFHRDVETNDPPEVLVFCPDCDKREFAG
jgi:hypothetical protein